MCNRMLRTIALLACTLVAVLPITFPTTSPAAAQTTAGTIAYVRADTEDEIRLIAPDGRDDRRLWAHGLADPNEVMYIYNLAWRPDASELAFASTHENTCSINHSDIFAVRPNGSGYRRITQAPACAALAAYPKGIVKVPVKNVSIFSTLFGFVYFQGASSLQPVVLPPGGSTVVTFNDVADFGPDVLQRAAIVDDPNRDYPVESVVDVQAGRTVTTAGVAITPPSIIALEAHAPTWRSDGGSLSYVYGASLYNITANPKPIDFGRPVIDPEPSPGTVSYMAYGPATRANQILFQGDSDEDGQSIFLATEGATTLGQPLVSHGYLLIRGLAWLPDGSGFVYAVEEEVDFDVSRANLFEYSFASKQTRRLTNFTNTFAGQLSVSPDGKQIVFDRATAKDDSGTADVWIMNRDGSGQRLLASNAYAPAWSPRALPAPLAHRVYLPLTRR